jgi:uncharacterized protein
MLLDLSKIRTPHEHYRNVLEPSAFKADEDYRIVEPVTLEFDIHKDKETFRLVGRVQATLELACSRCLEPFRWAVDEPFELTYEPRQVDDEHVEREIAHADFSAALYDNDAIDLEQLVKERFEMSVPMKPLCVEACKGLCALCGANLNRTTCDCKHEWEDPRFAALRGLKN